jgi:hypothetical protein
MITRLISIFAIVFLVGCSLTPKDKIEYGPWETARFKVWAITVEQGTTGPATAILNTFKNGKLIEIDLPEGNYKEGDEVTLTYRKVTKTICTDQNCRFEESYEVK